MGQLSFLAFDHHRCPDKTAAMFPPNQLFEVSATYWLIVLALSLCVVVGYLWRFAFGKPDGSGRRQRVTAFAAALILCLTAVDGLNFVQRELSSHLRVFGTVAVIAATAGLTWLHLSHWKMPRALLRSRLSGWLIILSSVSLAGWSYHRFQQRLYPPPKKPMLLLSTPGKKQVIHEFVAVTDQNRPIRVFRMAEDESDPLDENEATSVNFMETTIQRGPADPAANCHGWVFLDSQFLIDGEAVQYILDDNGYELTSEPMAGDVIVYRSDNRDIIHSGLVRGVLNDGTIIIESKWGIEGTFLHDPEGTPYSTIFEYYRSPRPDNRVKIVPVNELPLDE